MKGVKERKEKKQASVPVPCPLIFPEALCKGLGMKWKHSVQLSSWPASRFFCETSSQEY